MRRWPTFAWASRATAPVGACWWDCGETAATGAPARSTGGHSMRWYIAAAGAAAAIAVAVACGSGSGGSKDIISPTDAGVDAGIDAGVDAGPPDAGDGGIDGGTDAGPDAGPWHRRHVMMVPNSGGWHLSSNG